MDLESQHEITALLMAWRDGDQSALERLVPLVERELRVIARSCLDKERTDADLQTTGIINEVYVRLIDSGKVRCHDRSHFYAICARIMRRILVDHARERGTAKRGGGAVHVPIDEAFLASSERMTDLLVIDEALTSLASVDPRKGQVVELRFFGGLSVEETAQALHISEESVMRDWRLAKLWMLRFLRPGAEAGENAGA